MDSGGGMVVCFRLGVRDWLLISRDGVETSKELNQERQDADGLINTALS